MWFSRNTKFSKMIVFVTRSSECFSTSFERKLLQQTLKDLYIDYKRKRDSPKKLLVVINCDFSGHAISAKIAENIKKIYLNCTEYLSSQCKALDIIEVLEVQTILVCVNEQSFETMLFDSKDISFDAFIKELRGIPIDSVRLPYIN